MELDFGYVFIGVIIGVVIVASFNLIPFWIERNQIKKSHKRAMDNLESTQKYLRNLRKKP